VLPCVTIPCPALLPRVTLGVALHVREKCKQGSRWRRWGLGGWYGSNHDPSRTPSMEGTVARALLLPIHAA
jgi:hypothetical protein